MRIGRYVALISLLAPAAAWPQAHDHSRPDPPPVERPDTAQGDLSGLLRSGDEVLRLTERALERDDGPAVTELVARFISGSASIENLFASDSPPPARDAARTRRALERHVRALSELASRTPAPEAREPLDAAHDAAQRALDAVEAAEVEAAPPPASGHQGSRRRGCGH